MFDIEGGEVGVRCRFGGRFKRLKCSLFRGRTIFILFRKVVPVGCLGSCLLMVKTN